jgi:hypothetical protein
MVKVYDDMWVTGTTAEIKRIAEDEGAAVNAREIERLAAQLAKLKRADVGWDKPYDSLVDRLDAVMRQESEASAIAYLRHANPNVRWVATRRLGELKSVQAVPLLLVALKDRESAPRGGAVWALGKIGDERGADELVAMVEKRRSGSARTAAIEALGEIATPRCLEAIASVEPDDSEYWKAEKTLADLRQRRADLQVPAPATRRANNDLAMQRKALYAAIGEFVKTREPAARITFFDTYMRVSFRTETHEMPPDASGQSRWMQAPGPNGIALDVWLMADPADDLRLGRIVRDSGYPYVAVELHSKAEGRWLCLSMELPQRDIPTAFLGDMTVMLKERGFEGVDLAASAATPGQPNRPATAPGSR